MRPSFAQQLADGRVFLADGATGTNYQAMGLQPGKAPEEWLFDDPEKVLELHRSFIEAGSQIVLTCSFGATRLRLADGPLVGKADAVNTRAVELALDAAQGRALIAGSMGPTGQLCEPLGSLTIEECAANYAEQAHALADAGADLLVLETFFALEEALAAISGIRETSDLPLVVTFSFDRGTKTMMGLSPQDVLGALLPYNLAAVGANCGRSLSDTDLIVDELLSHGGETPIWVKPNAGLPNFDGAKFVYQADPATLAAHLRSYLEKGVRIVGGCCGSTPAHIAAVTIEPWSNDLPRRPDR